MRRNSFQIYDGANKISTFLKTVLFSRKRIERYNRGYSSMVGHMLEILGGAGFQPQYHKRGV